MLKDSLNIEQNASESEKNIKQTTNIKTKILRNDAMIVIHGRLCEQFSGSQGTFHRTAKFHVFLLICSGSFSQRGVETLRSQYC